MGVVNYVEQPKINKVKSSHALRGLLLSPLRACHPMPPVPPNASRTTQRLLVEDA